jgi:hypothetical protein
MTASSRSARSARTALALAALTALVAAGCGRPVAGTTGAPPERRWAGRFRPNTLGATSAGIANGGTALFVPISTEPVLVRYELRLSAPILSNRTVSWSVLDGECDVPSFPIAAPGDFPPLDVPTSGEGFARGDLAVNMVPGRPYHVNLYFGRRAPADHANPVLCATLQYSGPR